RAVADEAPLRGDLRAVLAELEDALVERRALVVAHLARLRHAEGHVARVPGPERPELAAVLRVLVGEELDVPALDARGPPLALRERRDIEHVALSGELREL